MRLLFAVLILAAAGCAKSAAPSGLPPDFASLVPADAAAVVHLRSLDELLVELNVVAKAADPSAQAMTAPDLLGMPLALIGQPELAKELLLDQPLGLAYGMGSAATRPVITIIVAARQPEELGAKFANMPDSSVAISGQFVALRIGEGRASTAGGSPLLEDFPAGLFALRADLGAILKTFRPLIDIGLVEVEDALRSGADQDPEMPVDPAEMIEWYLKLARDLMDSAERMDLAMDLAGGVFALRTEILHREGSPMASVGLKESVDYRALAGRLDPEAAIHVVGSFDQGRMMEQFQDFYRAMIDAVAQDESLPPEAKEAFRVYIEGMLDVVPMMGRETALCAGYEAGKLRVAGEIEAQDPAAVAERLLELLQDPALAAMGMKATAETAGKLAGQPSINWRQSLDFAQMVRVMGLVDEIPPGMAERFAQGMDVVLMPAEERLRVVAGGDAAWREAAAQRLVAGGSASAELARGLEPLAGANPAQYMRMDMKPVMALFVDVGRASGDQDLEMEKLSAALAALGEQPLVFDFYWGVKKRAMVAGFGMDLRGFAQMMAAASR